MMDLDSGQHLGNVSLRGVPSGKFLATVERHHYEFLPSAHVPKASGTPIKVSTVKQRVSRGPLVEQF